MDPSYRAPTEPPEDWAKKFYKSPPPGKHRTIFRYFFRNEYNFAVGLGIFCVSLWWYPILSPFFTGFGDLFRMSPEQFKREWNLMWIPKTPEERRMIQERGGKHIHRLSDILDGSMGYRPSPQPQPQPPTPTPVPKDV